MANIINLTVDDSAETVNVTVSDGILTAQTGGTFISGFLVKKGTGNTAATIEIGDYLTGWIGNTFISGISLVAGTPTLVSQITSAVIGEAL